MSTKAKVKNLAPVSKDLAPEGGPKASDKPREVVAFVVPAPLMDTVVKYLTAKPYIEVGSIIDAIRSGISPIYKPTEDEKKDNTTPNV